MPTPTGTREWSQHSLNNCTGCSNACNYCYARSIALRFGRISTVEEWATEKVRRDLSKEVKSYRGVVMFPTTHDITPGNVGSCAVTLSNLLAGRNSVLVVSKPRLEVMERILDDCSNFKFLVEFRFSITSLDDRLSLLWEPGASLPAERVECLELARSKGFAVSVSMEPTLDMTRVVEQFRELAPLADSIWIGKMNDIRRRVVNVPEEEIQAVVDAQCDEVILEVVGALNGDPKVRWKDSIQKVIGVGNE